VSPAESDIKAIKVPAGAAGLDAAQVLPTRQPGIRVFGSARNFIACSAFYGASGHAHQVPDMTRSAYHDHR
jgi:hypothetical protein